MFEVFPAMAILIRPFVADSFSEYDLNIDCLWARPTIDQFGGLLFVSGFRGIKPVSISLASIFDWKAHTFKAED